MPLVIRYTRKIRLSNKQPSHWSTLPHSHVKLTLCIIFHIQLHLFRKAEPSSVDRKSKMWLDLLSIVVNPLVIANHMSAKWLSATLFEIHTRSMDCIDEAINSDTLATSGSMKLGYIASTDNLYFDLRYGGHFSVTGSGSSK